MLRMLLSLSASVRSFVSRSASFKCARVHPFRSSQLFDLSSLSSATSLATLTPNCSCSSLYVTPASSTVSWSSAAAISSSSSVIIAVIRAVSRGCVMYGIEVPLRNIPLCACSANLAALVIIRYSFPSSFNDMDIYLAEWNLNSSLIK